MYLATWLKKAKKIHQITHVRMMMAQENWKPINFSSATAQYVCTNISPVDTQGILAKMNCYHS